MFSSKNNGAEADLNTIVYLGQGRCNCSCETISRVTLQPLEQKNQKPNLLILFTNNPGRSGGAAISWRRLLKSKTLLRTQRRPSERCQSQNKQFESLRSAA